MMFVLIFFYSGLTAFGVLIMWYCRNYLPGRSSQRKMALWKQLAVGLCIGQGCYSLLLWLSGMLGGFVVMVWAVPVCSILYYSWWGRHYWLSDLPSWRLPQGHILKQFLKQSKTYFVVVGFLVVGGITICLFQKYALIASAYPIEGVPGMGNWGYKAKIIYQHQGVPVNYISDYSTHYGKFSYPLGFPLLSAAVYTVVGGVEEAIVRVNTAVFLAATFTIIALQCLERWRWLGFFGIIGFLGFFLGKPAYEVLESFYAEPLLLYCVAAALVCLIDGQFLFSLICAGCAAWTKQEGIVFFGLLAMCVCLFHWRQIKLISLYSGIVGFLFIILWRIYLWWQKVSDSDFSLLASDDKKMQAAWEKVYELGVENGYHYSSAAYLLPVILLSSIILKESAMFVCGMIAAVMVGIFIFSMRYSNVKLDWHLWSADRYLMLPTVCILMGVSAISLKRGELLGSKN